MASDFESAVVKTSKLLKLTNLPFRYLAFSDDDAVKMPFITYQFLYSDNMAADGEVYVPISRVQINLFTAQKDLKIEQQVESVLKGHFWTKEEEYIDSQDCYQITYEIELEGN